MEAVLDTNVAVSAAINPKGPPAEIIKAWRARSFSWVTSPALLQELESTLRSPRLRRYIAWSDDELLEFLALVRAVAKIVIPTSRIDAIRVDPADNRVLEAAAEGGVDYVVTGDRHLLDMGRCGNIPIVTPVRFVAIIATGLG
jgi:putative PIN family toxin of toxin-antitoxin system